MGYASFDRNPQPAPETNDQQREPYPITNVPLNSGSVNNTRDATNKDYAENEYSQQPLVRQWPAQSRQIWVFTPSRICILILDLVLASAPIMFIVLALVAARLDGKNISPYGQHIQQMLLVSPTIFPVIFAALMGRCFRSLGLFLVGRGTTLGRLEQLIGCSSLFSALERQVTLHSWSLVGLTLSGLWLLSPLGGQSALRLMKQEPASVRSTATVKYLNPTAFEESFMIGGSGVNAGRSTFTSIFLAALLSSTRYGSTAGDLWGNVKIPVYRSIENTTSDDWKMVPDANITNITYASLIGIPVANISNVAQSSFSIKARQFDITCDKNEKVTGDEAQYGNATSTWKMAFEDPASDYPSPFVLKSVAEGDDYTVANCALSFEYLEVFVNCNGTSCAAKWVKKLDLLGDDYGENQDTFTRQNIAANIMAVVTTVDSMGVKSVTARGSVNAEKYMMDPSNFIGASVGNVQLYELPTDVLASRLTIVFNTFFQSTYATLALDGNLPNNLTSLSDGVSPKITFNNTIADLSSPSLPVYRTNWKWFTLLLVSSIILQVAAYVGFVLKYYTCVPDIIGYASSMTLLNPYVPIPTGGTTLQGLERAALLRDLPVRIGDVCPNEPVGAIAFARADDERVGRLDRTRFYI